MICLEQYHSNYQVSLNMNQRTHETIKLYTTTCIKDTWYPNKLILIDIIEVQAFIINFTQVIATSLKYEE